MDNHTPVNTGSPYDFQYDRYHPTVDSALDGGGKLPAAAGALRRFLG